MITATVVLSLIGLFLIYFEFFLPGAVMGIFGAILLCVSIILLVIAKVPTVYVLSSVILLMVLTFLVIKGALWHMKNTKKNKTFFLDDDQQGYCACFFDASLINKVGVAATDLKPSGYIMIDNKRIEAVSSGEYIEKNEGIKVIHGEGARVIVKKYLKEG
jgi:membrane-bound ClpP family serine protease